MRIFSFLHCVMVGHDDRFVREAALLALQCDECGRRTRGWAIGPETASAACNAALTSKAATGAAVRVGAGAGQPTADRQLAM